MVAVGTYGCLIMRERLLLRLPLLLLLLLSLPLQGVIQQYEHYIFQTAVSRSRVASL